VGTRSQPCHHKTPHFRESQDWAFRSRFSYKAISSRLLEGLPARQVTRWGVFCSEQHAGSAGALLDFGQPAHAQKQQPEAERAAREELEEEEELVEEEEQRQQSFSGSLEGLAGHDGSEKVPGPELPGSEEEEEEEESLAVAEQVADFASSLLAALHCWHYRANALLFSRGAMVRCLFDLPSPLHGTWHVLVLPVSFPLSPYTVPSFLPSILNSLTVTPR
jgi:hypothetical protein